MRLAAAMSSSSPEAAEPIYSVTLSDLEEEATLWESSDSGSGEGAAVELAESEWTCMVGYESGAADRDIEPCSTSQIIDAVSPHALSFTPTRSRCSEGSVALHSGIICHCHCATVYQLHCGSA